MRLALPKFFFGPKVDWPTKFWQQQQQQQKAAAAKWKRSTKWNSTNDVIRRKREEKDGGQWGGRRGDKLNYEVGSLFFRQFRMHNLTVDCSCCCCICCCISYYCCCLYYCYICCYFCCCICYYSCCFCCCLRCPFCAFAFAAYFPARWVCTHDVCVIFVLALKSRIRHTWQWKLSSAQLVRVCVSGCVCGCVCVPDLRYIFVTWFICLKFLCNFAYKSNCLLHFPLCRLSFFFLMLL